MRTEILNFVQTLNLGTVTVSTELPYTENAVPLYIKNLKKVYVDTDDAVNEPIIQSLDGVNISNEVTSVRLFFACDAKTLLPNYDTIVTDLKTAKDITTITGVQRREVEVTTSTESDVLVTQLEYRFTKLST